jgi:hypothetical protein
MARVCGEPAVQQQALLARACEGEPWGARLPYSNPDGTPSSKSRYVWSQTTQQWMVAPMQDGLRKVKNDPDLQSSATNAGNYVVLNGITAVGSPESGDAPRGCAA